MELCVVQGLIHCHFLWHRDEIHLKLTVLEVVFTDKVAAKQTQHSYSSGFTLCCFACEM